MGKTKKKGGGGEQKNTTSKLSYSSSHVLGMGSTWVSGLFFSIDSFSGPTSAPVLAGLGLDRVDPSPPSSLDFFLRDLLAGSGMPARDGDSQGWLESCDCRFDLTLPSDESLEWFLLLGLVDGSFFLGEDSFVDEWCRLDDFGTSGKSLPGESGGLLLLLAFESAQDCCNLSFE